MKRLIILMACACILGASPVYAGDALPGGTAFQLQTLREDRAMVKNMRELAKEELSRLVEIMNEPRDEEEWRMAAHRRAVVEASISGLTRDIERINAAIKEVKNEE